MSINREKKIDPRLIPILSYQKDGEHQAKRK